MREPQLWDGVNREILSERAGGAGSNRGSLKILSCKNRSISTEPGSLGFAFKLITHQTDTSEQNLLHAEPGGLAQEGTAY